MMFNANKMIGIESRGFIFGSPLLGTWKYLSIWQENLANYLMRQ